MVRQEIREFKALAAHETHTGHAHSQSLEKAQLDILRPLVNDSSFLAHFTSCSGVSMDSISSWIGADPRLFFVFSVNCRRYEGAQWSADFRTVLHYVGPNLSVKHTPLRDAYVSLLLATVESDDCVDARLLAGTASRLNGHQSIESALERAAMEIFGSRGYLVAKAKLHMCARQHGWY